MQTLTPTFCCKHRSLRFVSCAISPWHTCLGRSVAKLHQSRELIDHHKATKEQANAVEQCKTESYRSDEEDYSSKH